MSDPRPGFQQVDRRRDWVRLPRSEVTFGLLVGLLLSMILVAVMPDVRHHMFGGTEKRTTTVVAADSEPRKPGDDREVARYRLTWTDDDGRTQVATFSRSGPVRHDVGDTWELWVSPDRPKAIEESPLTTWLWLGLGMPVISLIIGWLWAWRSRVLGRSLLRDVEKNAARTAERQRRRSSGD